MLYRGVMLGRAKKLEDLDEVARGRSESEAAAHCKNSCCRPHFARSPLRKPVRPPENFSLSRKKVNFPGIRGLSLGTPAAVVGIVQSAPFGMSI